MRKIGPLTISPAMQDDIEHVHRARVSDIAEVSRALEAIQPPTIRISAIRAAVSELPIDQQCAGAILRICLSLSSLMNRMDVEAEDAVGALREGLLRSTAWASRIGQLEEKFASLVHLASLDSMILSTKAMELQHMHPCLFTNARVTTDVRPVFDNGGHKVEGVLIAHILHIDYYSNNDGAELQLALDDDDLRQLIACCQRALGKPQGIRATLSIERLDNIVVVGEEQYGAG